MDKEAVGELMRGLDVLSAKLGVGAQVLWSALLKQAPIDSACSLVIFALTIVGGWLYFAKLVPLARRAAGDDNEAVAFVAVVGTIIGGVALLIFGIACVFSIDTIVAGFINPEYWALNHILHAMKK